MGAKGTLRTRLDAGGQLTATFLILPRVEVIQAVALAGFDAVIIDLEHGPFGIEVVPALVAAAERAGIHAIVRVADRRPVGIGAALDAGAEGILVPHVTTATAARDVVDAARFAPVGHRGANPWVLAGSLGTDEHYFSEANARTVLMAMVEGTEGIQNLDDILAVEGIDHVFVGPVDLSHSLGRPGEVDHPDVIAAVGDVVRRSRSTGRSSGAFAASPEAANRWRRSGVNLVALGVDTGHLVSGLAAARALAVSD